MDIIKQTNRCILFEDFNPEKDDLLTLLSGSNSYLSLDDDKIKEINEALLVRNFNEFMERFSPTIYALYDVTHNKMRYSLTRPALAQGMVQTISLNKENDFVKMFIELLDEKKKNGKQNQLFHFEHLLDYLLPHKRMEQIKESQVKLLEYYQKYVTLPEEEMEQRSKLLKEMDSLLIKEMEKYDDIMSLLSIAMEDMKQKLFPRKKASKAWNPIAAGMLGMKEEDVHILDLPELGQMKVANLEFQYLEPLKDMIIEHYHKSTDNPDMYIEHLILHSYGLEPQIQKDLNYEEITKQYNGYLDFYLEASKEFMRVAKPLMEKILGVKAFFDQYYVKKVGMGMELLITNVRNDLWIDIRKTERLNVFLETVNSKNDYENTLWFAILPNITFPPEKVKELSRERFRGTKCVI